MLACLRANHAHFASAVNGFSQKVKVLPADSLYLARMDCRGLGMDTDALNKFMLTRARLWLDKGPEFGAEGHGHMHVSLDQSPCAPQIPSVRRATASGLRSTW